MQAIHLGTPELPVDIDVDILHRTGTVERDQGDQVLDRIGLHLFQRIAHARAFQLEHADRMPRLEKVEGRLVVEIDALDIRHILAGRRNITQRPRDHRQRLEAQKVKLHQACRLNPFHVELGCRDVGPRIAIERDKLGEFAIADHHACGVRGGVAEKAFQLQRHGEQAVDGIIVAPHLVQAWLDIQRLGQGHRIGRIGRHQLGQLVDKAERKLKHPACIAHHGTGLQGTESDDLGDPVVTVAFLHIADHLAPPLLTEIDVEVGHRHPFRIEKPLEQETETQRVQIGNGQCVGDQRTGAGPPPRPDRDIMRLGPLDEVRNDQEVTRKPHLPDNAEFEIQPLAVFGLRRRIRARRQPRRQPFMRARGQFLGLVAPVLGREGWQDRLVGAHSVGAAPGDLDRVRQRLGQVGKPDIHLLRRGQIVLCGNAAPVLHRHERAFRDAQQRVMRLVHRRVGKIGLIRGDERQRARIGLVNKPVLRLQLLGASMALKLDIEAIAEARLQRFKQFARFRQTPADNHPVEDAVGTAGKTDQPFSMLKQARQGNVRLFRAVHIQIGRTGQGHEVFIAGPVLDEKDKRALRLGTLARMRIGRTHRQGTTHNGLDARPGHHLGKLERTEEIIAVGQGNRRHAVGLAGRHHLRHADGTLQQRIRRPDAKVHKG